MSSSLEDDQSKRLEDIGKETTNPIPNSDQCSSIIDDSAKKVLSEKAVDVESIPSTPSVVDPTLIQKWNQPRMNILRAFGAFWGFLINGAHDASFGPLIPYLEDYYHINYTVVSLLFVSPFIGYVGAAILNNRLLYRFGRRGPATIAPLCRLIPYIIIALHPPYAVIVVVLIFAGFGSGYQDANWNAWLGTMSNANQMLGFLHGFYGLGAMLSPLIATAMVAKYHRMWYEYYYVMIGASVFELVVAGSAFWTETGSKFKEAHAHTGEERKGSIKDALFTRPAARVTWLCALFLLGYVGTEVALGGWITTFMINVRHAALFPSGMTATGFWLGLTIGRFILGFVTPKIGERLAITIYLPIVMGLQILFWLVPHFYVSTVAVAFEGFFLGPMFPGAVVTVTRLLPSHLHISAISTAAALGKCGGTVFPFAVGAIAQSKGVQVLQPVIVALIATIFVLWLCLPKAKK